MCTAKICVTCKIEKYLDEFSFRKDNNKYRNECKKCRCIQQKIYAESNEEKYKENRKKNYAKHRDKILKDKKEYHIKHKEEKNDYNRNYYKLNKEKILKQDKIYKQKNKERYQINKKILYEKNKEIIYQKHKQYIRTEFGRTSRANTRLRRRAVSKRGNVCTENLLILKKTAKTCYWCGCNLKGKSVHIDHYVPLSKGGEHTLENLVISCSKCNLSKNAKDPIDFANSIGKLF